MSSVTIVLYTSKTLKNGQHPIMLRVIKDRKSYYKSTGYSSLLEHWDVNKELPNKKHPLYKDLSILLQAKKLEVDSEKMNLERSNENFSPQQVLGIVKASSKSTKIIDYISEIITEFSVSKFPVGSSAKINSGFIAMARAIATLCCSPPESWLGKFLNL